MAFKFILAALSATAALAQLSEPATQCRGYRATNVVQGDSYLSADLVLIANCSVFSKDVEKLKLLVEYQTDTRLHVLIEDADEQVYQIQDRVLPRPKSQNTPANKAALKFNFTQNPFTFKVIRASNGDILFDTSSSPLNFESQYVRLRTNLPQNPYLYGLGEHSDDFRLPTVGYTRTLWNADGAFLPTRSNLYGSHPVYFEHRGNSGTHGVFLLNANGMDVRIDQTDSGQQYLEYNTLGGVLDLYFLAGPEPASVSKQYAEVVGLPAAMPYWTFGFHQCKYGWPNIDHVAEVVANYSAAGIPLETVWGDIDYMDAHRDFTVDPNRFPLDKVRALVDSLHSNNQHYIQILDPGISRNGSYGPYARGEQKGAFLRVADGSDYRGMQWAGQVVWPDWFSPAAQDWWTSEIQAFYDPKTGIDVDGLWNDMNEVSNFCGDTNCFNSQSTAASLPRRPVSRYTRRASPAPKLGLPGRDLFNPKYRINNHLGAIYASTLWTNITNADGSRQYDTHNLYGSMMASASRAALLARRPNKRPFVLTRSSFAGVGRAAAHWFGDNASTWEHYRTSIRQMLAFAAMHAVPMVGSDVCGFNGVAEQYMCARWALLGAFQPFYRNHADITAPDQEFYRWPIVAAAARKAIDVRYRLLDYIYTAVWRASVDGTPAINPLWFWYPGDEATWTVQTQWGLGDSLLISPVVDENSTSVTFYLPKDVWYDFWTGEKVVSAGETKTMGTLDFTDIPVHIRGGSILALRSKSANTTAELRKQNFALTVAPGSDGTAKGFLYLDDGESLDVGNAKSEITFKWDGSVLTAEGTFGYHTDLVIESVTVLGQGEAKKALAKPLSLSKGFTFRP
ncbi:glycoside hydrolase family 31 protein [Thermothielavioides terrestris NRRL 8126]|uniref:alpha-glucosidase n=1 Tax=Thermothielavioides terrestris (strain ATCC 38088 / NRRL 8126) TaxID=578455 RepID=G2R5Q4_THETT|nr:glycoside hydrolase family 31 protein [Thermothielavioides terrestris NRRL 8126]AEO68345.1 glycoside hydrolase family 31 protein [Thermothielavioides terrestris NRRL 8126]